MTQEQQQHNRSQSDRKLSKAYTIIAMIIVGAGGLHTLLTFIDYTELSAEAVWFAGSGLGLMTIGLFNYVVIRTHAKDRIINGLSYIANAFGIIMIAFAGITLVDEPQPIPLVLLLMSASILALKMSRRSVSKDYHD
jgi:hypothetical protein